MPHHVFTVVQWHTDTLNTNGRIYIMEYITHTTIHTGSLLSTDIVCYMLRQRQYTSWKMVCIGRTQNKIIFHIHSRHKAVLEFASSAFQLFILEPLH